MTKKNINIASILLLILLIAAGIGIVLGGIWPKAALPAAHLLERKPPALHELAGARSNLLTARLPGSLVNLKLPTRQNEASLPLGLDGGVNNVVASRGLYDKLGALEVAA